MNRESVKDDITQRTPTILKGPTCSYCLEEGVVDWKWKNCKHYGKAEGKRGKEFDEWKHTHIIGEKSVKEYLTKFHSDIVRPLIDLSFESSNKEVGIAPLPRHARFEDGSEGTGVDIKTGEDISVITLLPMKLPGHIINYDMNDMVVHHMIICLDDIRKKFKNQAIIYTYPTGSLNVINSCFYQALAIFLARRETDWTVREIFCDSKNKTFQEYPYSGHFLVEKILTLQERIEYLESELKKRDFLIELSNLKKTELVELCEQKGIAKSGNKSTLIERITSPNG